MADEYATPVKKNPKKKNELPPLSPKNDGNADEEKPKPVKRKKKKSADGVENDQTVNNGDNPVPRRKAKPRPSATASGLTNAANGSGENVADTVPKRKKKKPMSKSDGEKTDEPQISDRSATSAKEDISSSKTSLIKEEGTPKKKGRKKKRRNAEQGQGDTDDFADSYLASELQDIREDIVITNTKVESEKEKTVPYQTSATILQSQPLDKIFIETNRGFRGFTKAQISRRLKQEEEEKAAEPEKATHTTLEFGLSTHKVFQTMCLFLHGLTAGLALWQVVIVWVLDMQSNQIFLVHYQHLALPVQCMFYLLFALCLVSACDRCDIGNLTPRFIVQALTLQNGAISILFYLVSLVISLALIDVEDRMHLQSISPQLWNSTSVMDSELQKFRSINTVRGVSAVLGWFVIALVPIADRLSKDLRDGDDELLQGGLELDQVSAA